MNYTIHRRELKRDSVSYIEDAYDFPKTSYHPSHYEISSTSDVIAQVAWNIKEGICADLNCGYNNGGDNHSEFKKATKGVYCEKCAKENSGVPF